jgi:hypothetical protein
MRYSSQAKLNRHSQELIRECLLAKEEKKNEEP